MSIDVLFVVCTTVSAHCQEITQAPSQNQKLKRQKLRSKNPYKIFQKNTQTPENKKNKNTKDTKGKKPDCQAKAHKHKRANLNPKNNALTQNV